MACVSHGNRMCECPLSAKTLEFRFSDNELEQLVSDVRNRAERPAIWMVSAFVGVVATQVYVLVS